MVYPIIMVVCKECHTRTRWLQQCVHLKHCRTLIHVRIGRSMEMQYPCWSHFLDLCSCEHPVNSPIYLVYAAVNMEWMVRYKWPACVLLSRRMLAAHPSCEQGLVYHQALMQLLNL